MFLLTSASIMLFGGEVENPYTPETYVFGSDAEGNVEEWNPLLGSCIEDIPHEEALRRVGYLAIQEISNHETAEWAE